jgi:hypothetical protein
MVTAWLTVSRVGAPAGTVNIYDSLYRSVSSHVKKQISSIIHITRKDNFVVEVKEALDQVRDKQCSVLWSQFSEWSCDYSGQAGDGRCHDSNAREMEE